MMLAACVVVPFRRRITPARLLFRVVLVVLMLSVLLLLMFVMLLVLLVLLQYEAVVLFIFCC